MHRGRFALRLRLLQRVRALSTMRRVSMRSVAGNGIAFTERGANDGVARVLRVVGELKRTFVPPVKCFARKRYKPQWELLHPKLARRFEDYQLGEWWLRILRHLR